MNDVYYKIEITAKKLFNHIRVHLFLYYYSTLLLKYPIEVTKAKIIIRNQMINFSIEKIEPK